MKNLFKFLCFLLWFAMTNACHQDATSPVAVKSQDAFFLRNTQQEILKTVDPQILAIVHKDLLTANRNSDAEKLLKTYDLVSGNLFSTIELPKGAKRPATSFTVTQNAYIQNSGWQSGIALGSTVGTTGQGLRLEAFRIMTSPYPPNDGITPYLYYISYLQDIGWQNSGLYTEADGISGTTGESRRIEAIRVSITTSYAGSIAYRAYVQDTGWLDWVGNNGIAGTTGQAKRLEAFQLTMVVYDQP